jgi:hypothetical protein
MASPKENLLVEKFNVSRVGKKLLNLLRENFWREKLKHFFNVKFFYLMRGGGYLSSQRLYP